jgi:hypothetical protein
MGQDDNVLDNLPELLLISVKLYLVDNILVQWVLCSPVGTWEMARFGKNR